MKPATTKSLRERTLDFELRYEAGDTGDHSLAEAIDLLSEWLKEDEHGR